jgi:hypothetical protein
MAVLFGQLSIEREQQLVESTRNWLLERSADQPIYAAYLEQWGSWHNPWLNPESTESQ